MGKFVEVLRNNKGIIKKVLIGGVIATVLSIAASAVKTAMNTEEDDTYEEDLAELERLEAMETAE